MTCGDDYNLLLNGLNGKSLQHFYNAQVQKDSLALGIWSKKTTLCPSLETQMGTSPILLHPQALGGNRHFPMCPLWG